MMRSNMVVLPALALALASAQATPRQASPPKIGLKVLFVGAAANAQGDKRFRAARTRDFAEFLAREFESARVAVRDDFDPASVGDADVVLLDWSQQEVDVAKMAELRSPLGPREAWKHPTVLLGSAGLLLAGPWQLQGAHG